ncbi:MAG: RHS repeat domain-containing protein [Sedimenticola sp.]
MDPGGQAARFTYDSRGNSLEVTDANGHISQSTYDAASRRTKATPPLLS